MSVTVKKKKRKKKYISDFHHLHSAVFRASVFVCVCQRQSQEEAAAWKMVMDMCRDRR